MIRHHAHDYQLRRAPGGPVEAPGGRTEHIREQALSLGGERLATMILDGVQSAGERAGEQARQAVSETVGDLVNFDDLIPPNPPRPSRSAPSWLGEADGPRTSLG